MGLRLGALIKLTRVKATLGECKNFLTTPTKVFRNESSNFLNILFYNKTNLSYSLVIVLLAVIKITI